MTAILHYRRLIPPDGREAWSHEETPELLVQHLSVVMADRDRRNDLRSRLRILYKVRVSADYISADDVTMRIDNVRKDAEFLVKVAQGIIS